MMSSTNSRPRNPDAVSFNEWESLIRFEKQFPCDQDIKITIFRNLIIGEILVRKHSSERNQIQRIKPIQEHLNAHQQIQMLYKNTSKLSFFLDPKFAKLIVDLREYFISMVSTSLLQETKYYASSDQCRDELVKTMNELAAIEPEFIVQTAYYVRHKMYIRTCTNFILAFAILNQKTQPFVAKYFNKTVLIPGDLIEVCQFVQVINLINKGIAIEGIQDLRKKLYFPSLLRYCVASKLKEFSLYQLGKKCSDSNRKKTIRQYQDFLNPLLAESRQAKRKAKLEAIYKAVNDTKNQDAIKQARQHVKERTGKGRKHTQTDKKLAKEAPKNVFDIKFVTLKDIIRFCHITEPKLVVMSVMGKKYPATPEEFHQQIKDETIDFDPEQAGKRMKVPVPVTWDRELSFKNASKKQIWTGLLTKNQVPYMALLRNLRNILKADLEVPILKKVIQTIQNPYKVQNSKIFPFQYFNALSEVDKLVSGIEDEQGDRGNYGRKGRGIRKPIRWDPREKLTSNQMEQEVNKPKFKLNQKIGQELKIAIQNALQIAVKKNLDEISGQTYVFCDVSGSMDAGISGGKKYGSITSCRDCGFILGLMIKQKCQKCEFYLFGSPNKWGQCSLKCDVDTNILEGFKRCQKTAESIGGGTQLGQALQDVLLQPKAFADTIIVLSDMMIHEGFSGNSGLSFEKVIKGYLSNVNPNAKFFFMNIQGYGVQVQYGDDLKGKNCFVISGMSDNVLRYISLAGSVDQVQDVRQFSQNPFYHSQVQMIESDDELHQIEPEPESEAEEPKKRCVIQ